MSAKNVCLQRPALLERPPVWNTKVLGTAALYDITKGRFPERCALAHASWKTEQAKEVQGGLQRKSDHCTTREPLRYITKERR